MTDHQPADTLTDEQIAELVRWAEMDAEDATDGDDSYPMLLAALRELQQRRAQDAQPQPATTPVNTWDESPVILERSFIEPPQPASARPDVEAIAAKLEDIVAQSGPTIAATSTAWFVANRRHLNDLAREALALARVPAPAASVDVEPAPFSWRHYAPKDHTADAVQGGWWHKPADWELVVRVRGRTMATAEVWLNGTWHTFGPAGIGGENAREATVDDAKREAEAALVRQGWAKPAALQRARESGAER